ncbi:hypothetical protein CKO40_19735 [Halochromatium glycolicum]|uniref:CbbQ/NirQ/NorQ C-terminal domain-containing protein n=1 Tax=Halochromatium glycolicum TaxID=85075 RepID=A0AAJ0U7N8_9GAMM|nr:hypothetical protein [Halochromatium glycolicum]
MLVYAATLIRAGMTPAEACRAALIEPLTDDPETIEALRKIVDAGLG